MFNIAVIYGSVRAKREGIKAAKFVLNKLKERGYSSVLIDPLEYKLPLLNKTLKEYGGEAPENLIKLSSLFKNADGYIVVTGEYNHNIPPALTNLMSYFGEEYSRKPAGIVSYSNGPFAGVRAAVQLREFLSAIGIVSVPNILPISKVQSAFDENGNVLDKNFDRRIEAFLKEFEWYVRALKREREL